MNGASTGPPARSSPLLANAARELPNNVDAVVVGAGPAGLAAAAELKRRHLEVLSVERAPRPAWSWHERYEGLRLNTVRWLSDLPGYRMHRRYGRWPRREDWAAYLERYADRHGLDIRCGVEVSRVDRNGDRWELQTNAGAIVAPVAVVATGHDRVAKLPDLPGRGEFEGRLLHSSQFRRADDFAGQDILVVGAGNSACEIAALLVAPAARVSIAVRTPPLMLPRNVLGAPLTVYGLVAAPLPDRVVDAGAEILHRLAFGDLSRYGLAGRRRPASQARHRYYSPPLDNGFVAAVKRGRIQVLPALKRFDGNSLEVADGRHLTPDVVIAATGYRPGLEPLVGHLGVLRDDGLPIGAPSKLPEPAPGLFFAGFTFGLLALLPHLRWDARRLAARTATKM